MMSNRTEDENWIRDETTGALLYKNKEIFRIKQRINKIERKMVKQEESMSEIISLLKILSSSRGEE